MIDLIDMHCHIIPSIDDGSKNEEQSINMLKLAYIDGIRTIIATPHYHIGRMTPECDRVNESFSKLIEIRDKENIDIKLYLGREIYYFSDAFRMIEEKKLHTMVASRYVLMEYDIGTDYTTIIQSANNAVMNGLIPIIAHVERYACMLDKYDRAIELIKLGALLQVNSNSVLGEHGSAVKKYIKKLLKYNLVAFVASDAHSDGHRKPALSEAYSYVNKKYGEVYANEIFRDNQIKIIKNIY